jgi:putative pyruvate formate lyase activating enzyme
VSTLGASSGLRVLADPYSRCLLCPHACGVDRSAGELGRCGETSTLRVAYAGLHGGEEPPLSGQHGSGTVFFTGCTLRCRFCQNWQISRRGMGAEVSVDELAGMYLGLARDGAANVNLVTGTHFLPHVLEADKIARGRGLDLPLVWNSSGYESIETLELIREQVRVYLLDVKSLDADLARDLFGTPDYPERARAASEWACAATTLRYRGELLVEGLVVRHLVVPGRLDSTRRVLEWFARDLARSSLLSLMFQYEPVGPEGLSAAGAPVPDRRVTREEYDQVSGWVEELDIEEGFIQEPITDSAWLPDFRRANPFSSELSRPLWSWIGRASRPWPTG